MYFGIPVTTQSSAPTNVIARPKISPAPTHPPPLPLARLGQRLSRHRTPQELACSDTSSTLTPSEARSASLTSSHALRRPVNACSKLLVSVPSALISGDGTREVSYFVSTSESVELKVAVVVAVADGGTNVDLVRALRAFLSVFSSVIQVERTLLRNWRRISSSLVSCLPPCNLSSYWDYICMIIEL